MREGQNENRPSVNAGPPSYPKLEIPICRTVYMSESACMCINMSVNEMDSYVLVFEREL